MKRRRPWWAGVLWVVALMAIAVAVLWYIPSGQVAISPGITGNLKQMIEVKDGHKPGPGKLLMVAIDVGSANELQYLLGRLNPTMAFQPQQLVLGGLSMNQYVQYNNSLMQQSQWSAEVAGERLAGLPAKVITVPGALVAGVAKTGAAAGKLKPGDLITQIGPYPVTNYADVRQVMSHFKVGEIVNITVKRNGQQMVIPIKTTHIQGDPDPAVGVLVAPLQRPVIPRPVAIKAQGIGGPSAGMMFALEIYEQVTGKNLAQGHIVAGTGEITPSGQVQVIGGVQQKVVTVYRAGARLFLVPKGNYAAAESMAKKLGYHMTILPVSNIHQALKDLESQGS